MARKKKKLQKMYKPRLKEKVFQKKFLRRLSIETDRNFLLSVYPLDEEGFRVLKGDLSDEETTRLRKLGKAIKQNRGAVKTGRLILLVLIAAGIIGFNYLFKDRLLERAAENGLEAVFQAKADVRGLSLRLFRGEVLFDYLEVASADEPFLNLFELGYTEISLNTEEMLKGNFVAENIIVSGIRWHTKRETSGVLEIEGPEREQSDAVSQEEKQAIALPRELSSLDFTKIDPKQMVDEKSAQLASLGLIDSIDAEITATSEKWRGTIDDVKGDLADFSGQVSQVQKINVSRLDSIGEIQNAVSLVEEVVPAAGKLKSSITTINMEIKNDRNKIDAEMKKIQAAVETDKAYLKSLVSLPEGGVKALVFSFAEQYLAERLGKIYTYGMTAKKFGDQLIANRKKDEAKEKKQQPERRTGVDILFPSRRYPRFLIENTVISVAGSDRTGEIDGRITGVTSDPDLWGKPTTLDLTLQDTGKRLSINGTLDTRSQSEESFALSLGLTDYPFSIPEGIDVLGISRFSSVYRFDTSLTADKAGATAGTADLSLTGIEIERQVQTNPLIEAVYSGLTTAPSVDFDVTYSITPEEPPKISGQSNVDDIISAKIKEYLQNLLKQYQRQLEEELRLRVEEKLKDNARLYGLFQDIEKASGGNLTEIRANEKVLNAKKKELTDRIDKIEEELKEAAEGEAKEQLDNLKDKIKLPGF